MKLVDKPEDVMAKHSSVPAGRQKQLVGFLTNTDPDKLKYVHSTFVANAMPTAELDFVNELLGVKSTPAKPASKPATKPKAKR